MDVGGKWPRALVASAAAHILRLIWDSRQFAICELSAGLTKKTLAMLGHSEGLLSCTQYTLGRAFQGLGG
jgi:hypothetical protein